MGFFLGAQFWLSLFHQLWHKLLGVGQASMGLTGGSPEYPTIPSKAENKASDCVTFGRTCAQHSAPGALNRIIGQECSHRNGNDIKRETQNFKTRLVGPTNLPGPWGCDIWVSPWKEMPHKGSWNKRRFHRMNLGKFSQDLARKNAGIEVEWKKGKTRQGKKSACSGSPFLTQPHH